MYRLLYQMLHEHILPSTPVVKVNRRPRGNATKGAAVSLQSESDRRLIRGETESTRRVLPRAEVWLAHQTAGQRP